MHDIEKNINNLPIELQDYIYRYYWSNIFFKVLSELNDIKLLDNKINIFIKRYGNNILKHNNNYYYRQFNNLIEKITNNRGKMLFCKYNNLSLKHSNINYISSVCSSINVNYKYIAPILICNSTFLRYEIFYYLKSL